MMFQGCPDCEAVIFYPRSLCPVCGSRALEWRRSAGSGVVYATTTVYRRDEPPYDVSLVELSEGFRMMSRVEGVGAEEVVVGMGVTFGVCEEESGPVAVFRPEERG